jgi:phosphatidylglycerol lysyltransferase
MRQPDQGRRVPSGYRTPAGWARVLRGSPATLTFVVLVWAAGALSASLRSGPPSFLLPHVAATSHSVPDHWWALLLSAFWERDLAGYVVGTLVVLLAGLPLERRVGSLKFAAAALAGHVLGIVATLGFLAAARGLMGSWIRDLSGHFFLGPSALACAAAMAATAALSTLWRRRIRVVLLAVLLLFAMYAGGFEDLVRLGAAAAGGLLGPVLQGRRPRFGRPAVSPPRGPDPGGPAPDGRGDRSGDRGTGAARRRTSFCAEVPVHQHPACGPRGAAGVLFPPG